MVIVDGMFGGLRVVPGSGVRLLLELEASPGCVLPDQPHTVTAVTRERTLWLAFNSPSSLNPADTDLKSLKLMDLN